METNNKGMNIGGIVLSVLAILFLALDEGAKLFKPAPVVEAFATLQIPSSLIVIIGVLGLTCTIIYAIPQTAFLGAILLTGFLGGAIAIHLRHSDPIFNVLFPGIIGLFVWGGLFLRDSRLRALLPLTSANQE